MDIGGKPAEASKQQASYSKPLIIAVIGIVVVAAVGILNFTLDSPLSFNASKTAPQVAPL